MLFLFAALRLLTLLPALRRFFLYAANCVGGAHHCRIPVQKWKEEGEKSEEEFWIRNDLGHYQGKFSETEINGVGTQAETDARGFLEAKTYGARDTGKMRRLSVLRSRWIGVDVRALNFAC